MIIPYGKQEILKEDIDQVIDVLNSDYLTQGPLVPKFEERVHEYVDAKYAVASNSATSSLHLACLALDLECGDYVWTTPLSFVATANAALYCKANVKFIDIDPITFNLCPTALEEELVKAKRLNKLPKIVIPVHLCGQSADMQKIFKLSKEYNFKIIEDASHAIGGSYYDQKIGSSKFSDITVFSFHPVKIITTGEGGIACTNQSKLHSKMKLLSSHGITRDQSIFTNQSEGSWYYEQICLGFNYRLTDIQAGLGISQLKRLDSYVAKRNVLANYYDSILKDLPIEIPIIKEYNYSAYHLYVIRLDSKLGKFRKEIFEEIKKNGIGVNVHYIPIYKHPHYKSCFEVNDSHFPNTEDYYRRAITIPLFPSLSKKEQDSIYQIIKLSIEKYS